MSAGLVPLSESGIEAASDPAVYVELALARAKSWIADALEHGDIDQIVEIKSQAEAIRSYTAQKNLGKDVEMSALEIMRRAERGIGLAIRKGQEAGEIAKQIDFLVVDRDQQLPTPTQVSGEGDRSVLSRYYAMAAVPDDDFEEMLAEAKIEGNVSRRNLIRKVKGQPAPTRRPEHLRGTHHLDSARIVGEVVNTIYYAATQDDLFEQVQYDQLDSTNLREWISSLSESLKALGSLKRTLEKELNQRD